MNLRTFTENHYDAKAFRLKGEGFNLANGKVKNSFNLCLEFVILDTETPRQSHRSLARLKGPGFSGQNKLPVDPYGMHLAFFLWDGVIFDGIVKRVKIVANSFENDIIIGVGSGLARLGRVPG